MMKLVEILLVLVTKICEPNPKLLKDPSDHNRLLGKNKVFFWVLLCMALIEVLSLPYSGLPPKARYMMFITFFVNFILFLLLCRSYPRIFDFYFTLGASFLPVFLIDMEKDMVFSFSGAALVMPLLVFILTNSFLMMGFAEISQIMIMLTTYKRVFKEKLLTTDTDTFTEKFVGSSIFFIVFAGALFTVIYIMLQNKTDALAQANKATQEALEHQKTFVFSFSHELRNPINSLLGNLQLLLMSSISSEAKELVGTAKICGELLLQLINNVLDAGKHDIGKLEISPTPTNVHALFERLWIVSNELITRKNLQSHLKIEKKVPPMLLLDSHRINQIMMNLIGNAIKFTESGCISITIKWIDDILFNDKCFEPIPYDDDGIFEKEENLHMLTLSTHRNHTESYLILNKSLKKFSMGDMEYPIRSYSGVLKIIIRDTGCGMSDDDLHLLFQKFSQVSADTRKRQIGTGLGLFITREICRHMGGDVRTYSKPKVGSTFVVCIPTSSISATSQLQLSFSLETLINKLAERRLKTIVADDSPFNVNLICKFFSKIEAEVVTTAKDGYEAYKKYVEAREAGKMVDVLTLDIDMPRMDGKEACQKIREYERVNRKSPTVIILISGNYNEQQVNEFLADSQERKADFFLKKPLIFEEFCSTVYNLTKRS